MSPSLARILAFRKIRTNLNSQNIQRAVFVSFYDMSMCFLKCFLKLKLNIKIKMVSWSFSLHNSFII